MSLQLMLSLRDNQLSHLNNVFFFAFSFFLCCQATNHCRYKFSHLKVAKFFMYDKEVPKYVILDTILLLETRANPISKFQRTESE